MFAKRPHGLTDAMAALLCLWAAAYHTPVGALGRLALARLTGVRTSARPLLAYYSGGVWEAGRADVPASSLELPDPEQLAAIPPGPALGRACWATWSRSSPPLKARAAVLASRYGVQEEALAAPVSGPQAFTQLIERASKDLGSEDAAVLAVFAGFDVAQFAAERTRADQRPLGLQHLSTRLPLDTTDALDAASQALSLGTAFSLSWPLPAATAVTSGFGWRLNPVTGRPQLHTGIDLGVPVGTPVRATFKGTVIRVSEDALNGRLVIVDHGRGVTTAYCHNSAFMVRLGQPVAEGDVLAQSGSTGRSTGPHVHYQLELAQKPVDPLLFKGRSPMSRPTVLEPPRHEPAAANQGSTDAWQ